MRQHFDIFQQDAAACRHALAHAVPVVENGDAGAIERNEHADRLAVVTDGAEGAEIGKGRAGRIPFAAVKAITLTIGAETRGDFAGALGALFGAGAREELAGEDMFEMPPVLQFDGGESEVLGEIEMAAKCVRNIAVGFAKDHQHLDVVRNRAARAALGFGNAQRADLRLLDKGEDVEGSSRWRSRRAASFAAIAAMSFARPESVPARHAGIVGGGCLQFRIGHCGFP